MTSKTNDCRLVYSANESAIGDSADFWSNEFGWVQFDQATCFCVEEAGSLQLPISTGGDACFVPWQEARRHHG